MQKKNSKKWIIWSFTISLLFLLFLTVENNHASAIDLPPAMIIGDNNGIKVNRKGNYLIYVEDVLPGKEWSIKITAINTEKSTSYRLRMFVEKPTIISGNIDLSKAIQMKLIYDGKLLYDGPLSGVSKKLNLQDQLHPLDLGVFHSGDSKMIEAKFKLDGEKYTNKDFLIKNSVENNWHFHAVKSKQVPNTGKTTSSIVDFFPKTGEEWRETLLFICLGLFILLLIILIANYQFRVKRKKRVGGT